MRLTLLLALTLSMATAKKPPKPRPEPPKYRIFIGESETFMAGSAAMATRTAAGGSSYATTEKMTVLAMKAFHDNCSKLLVVDKPDAADYLLRLDRNGFWVRTNAIAIFNKSGEMVYAGKGVKLTTQAKRFCEKLP